MQQLTELIRILVILCSTHTHGKLHDNRTEAYLDKLPHKVMTCGPFSNYVAKKLKKKDFVVRRVCVLTLNEWDNRNNGHEMIEVFIGNRWLLFDVDMHCFYVQGDKILNTYQLVEIVKRKEQFTIIPILDDIDIETIEKQIRHLCHVSMMRDGHTWYGDKKNMKRIGSYHRSYRYRNDYKKKYYPES